MNLLMTEPPCAVFLIGDKLCFDTEASSNPTESYDIATDYRSILEIMAIFQNEKLGKNMRPMISLRVFYLDNVPDDVEQAYALLNRFVDCDCDWKQSKSSPRLYDWEQDGNAIYTGLNKCSGYILDREPYLHWWKFIGYFMDMSGECQFSDIAANRMAHKRGKATKEQKEARRLHPETYILKERQAVDLETTNRAKELERLMNA